MASVESSYIKECPVCKKIGLVSPVDKACTDCLIKMCTGPCPKCGKTDLLGKTQLCFVCYLNYEWVRDK